MSQEVVNSFNIFIDSERSISSSSNGNNIELPLGQTPISCASNQFIRLTLQSFSMYKSWTNVNANNNTFRVSCPQIFPAPGSGVALSNFAGFIPNKNYKTFAKLVKAFQQSLADILTTYTGVVTTPDLLSVFPGANETFEGTGNMAMIFNLDFAAGVTFTSPIVIQFKVADGDCFELLGGNRIRDVADTTTPSIACVNEPVAPAPTTTLIVSGYYNLQLSTQQNIYLRCGTSGSNIQTASYNAKFTDEAGNSNLASSNILGKVAIQNEFAVFTSATQMEYFLNLNVKSLTYLQLYITDSHDRPIPQYVNLVNSFPLSIAQDGGNNQDTLGNRSFECCIKVDIIQYLSNPNNTLQSKPVKNVVPARFGTEPLNKMDYGASNFQTPTFGMLNIKTENPNQPS